MKRFKDFIKGELLYAGLTKEDYNRIIPDMQRENRKSLLVFSGVSFFCLLVMFILSFLSADVADSRWVYAGMMLFSAVILVIAKFTKSSNIPLLLTDIYCFVGLLFTFGIVLGTVTRPDEQTVTFVALLLTVPLLFTDRPIRMIACILAFVAAFVVAAIFIKADYVLVADIIDVTIFGAISAIVSTYMMNVKCQKFLYAKKVYLLSETDMLTGLCNRNSFERNLKEYSAQGGELCCIYADVDGLHDMNNTKGHEAGDKMLQFVGNALQIVFGEKNTFRIGGDEFVALVSIENEDIIQQKISHVENTVKENGYHISVGYSVGSCSKTEINELINRAEKQMYDAKALYYRQKGIDRRIRK